VRVPAAALILALVVIRASTALAAGSPTYVVAFKGAGTEQHVDTQQNIQDSGLCDSAEHVDVTATLAWSTMWPGFKPGGKSTLGDPARIDGSRIDGTHVKDACGLPLDQAPEGWVSQNTCDAPLVVAGPPQLAVVHKSAVSLLLAVSAPPFSVPVSAQCPLNVRNDQLAAHVGVPLKKLQALTKAGKLTLAVGTTHPGPGDFYAPSLDCSRPTKPYEGYRTADRCQDELSWSGTVTIMRVS
jgi:hypothetical protein